jgi:hypothetical protein
MGSPEMIYGRLEWSKDQMAFHFAEHEDKRIAGWDVVAEDISSVLSSAFITSMNHTWEERQPLEASEIGEMFHAWFRELYEEWVSKNVGNVKHD